VIYYLLTDLFINSWKCCLELPTPRNHYASIFRTSNLMGKLANNMLLRLASN